ncbi:hypothetical protein HanOQP8_Chr16g0630701 [Helianthus annuus]|nr:hypothetical protein HanHA89_Chr16g0675911 [Helianthus annuus]KAJ0646038.1 hypothetical protein HanOQP8_Chr16g0630701 [Helianthus annuus]
MWLLAIIMIIKIKKPTDKAKQILRHPLFSLNKFSDLFSPTTSIALTLMSPNSTPVAGFRPPTTVIHLPHYRRSSSTTAASSSTTAFSAAHHRRPQPRPSIPIVAGTLTPAAAHPHPLHTSPATHHSRTTAGPPRITATRAVHITTTLRYVT